MTIATNKGNIRLKKVIEFAGSTSLGITLPRAFIRALGLRPGMFLACELKDEDKLITVQGLDLD